MGCITEEKTQTQGTQIVHNGSNPARPFPQREALSLLHECKQTHPLFWTETVALPSWAFTTEAALKRQPETKEVRSSALPTISK